MTNRDPFFDVVKALAMLLVVIGHTRWAFGCQVGNPAVDNFIVGMNMPVFFMVSGYFSARTILDGNWGKLGRHLVGYFWPLAVFSCFFAAAAMVLGIEGSDKGFVGYAGRNFLFSQWYLWCLAICFILTFLAARISKVTPHLVVLGIYCALPFITGLWHIENVRAMLPYFVFGLFVLRKWSLWRHRWVGLFCLVIYLLVVVGSNSFRQNGLSFYNGETQWSDFVSEPINILLLIVRIVLGVVGSLGVLWLIDKAVRYFPYVCTLIEPFGKTTLGVYILHQWILARCSEFLPVGPSLSVTLIVAVILFVGCHGLTLALRVNSILRKTVWGLWWES